MKMTKIKKKKKKKKKKKNDMDSSKFNKIVDYNKFNKNRLFQTERKYLKPIFLEWTLPLSMNCYGTETEKGGLFQIQ